MKKNFLTFSVLALFLFAGGMGFWHFFSNTQVLTQKSPAESLPSWTENVALVAVGDEDISSSDVDFEVNLLLATQHGDPDLQIEPGDQSNESRSEDTIKHETLASIIERKMLYQFISHDRNFDKDDPARYVDCIAEWQLSMKETAHLFKNKRDRERLKRVLCEGAVVRQYVEEQVYPKVLITEEEIKAYYRENSTKLSRPEQVTIKQILVNEEKLAKQIRYQLRPQNFSDFAAKHSQSPEGPKAGGLLGPFEKGEYPEIFDHAFRMRQGEISDVLKSPYGFHIFYLVAIERKMQPSLEQAKGQIRQFILVEKRDKQYEDLVNLASKRISIVPAGQTL